MKNAFSKYKILFWVVLVLLVLNVTIIGTMAYRYYTQQRMVQKHAVYPLQRHRPASFLRNELDMNEEQFRGFQEARIAHQEHVAGIHNRMRNLRSAYLDELMNAAPDTLRLGSLRDSIGMLHAGMMKSTGDYYGSIRKLCDDRQVDRLNAFFKDAMMNEGAPMMPMQGMRHQMKNPGRMKESRKNRN